MSVAPESAQDNWVQRVAQQHIRVGLSSLTFQYSANRPRVCGCDWVVGVGGAMGASKVLG